MHRTTSSVIAFAATVAAAVQATALIAQQAPADELAFISLPLTGDFPVPTHPSNQESLMPRFVIERDIPNLGQWTPKDLQAASRTSCGVLQAMGPEVQWVHSYVTGDKMYCVYQAVDEELVREHARRGGFPANAVNRILSVIDPTTAEAMAA